MAESLPVITEPASTERQWTRTAWGKASGAARPDTDQGVTPYVTVSVTVSSFSGVMQQVQYVTVHYVWPYFGARRVGNTPLHAFPTGAPVRATRRKPASRSRRLLTVSSDEIGAARSFQTPDSSPHTPSSMIVGSREGFVAWEPGNRRGSPPIAWYIQWASLAFVWVCCRSFEARMRWTITP